MRDLEKLFPIGEVEKYPTLRILAEMGLEVIYFNFQPNLTSKADLSPNSSQFREYCCGKILTAIVGAMSTPTKSPNPTIWVNGVWLVSNSQTLAVFDIGALCSVTVTILTLLLGLFKWIPTKIISLKSGHGIDLL